MKYLKILLIALITVFTFGSAMAQVTVKARIGPHHRHWHHRHHRWHHHDRY
jgi:hypothetical protein